MKRIINKMYDRPSGFTFIVSLSILFCILNLKCEAPTGPVGSSVITYTVSGGFAGGIHTKLVIDEYGQASLESEYPVLKQMLSGKEYNSLLRSFNGFDLFKDSYYGGCMDIPIYTIEFCRNNNTKIVSVDGCSLSDSAAPDIIKLKNITTKLSDLADRIYKNQAPWVGLAAEYRIEKNIYALSEPVKMTFILRNPTDKIRSLFFKTREQLSFNIYRTESPYYYYFYPADVITDSTPSVLSLNPGDEKTFYASWDQSFTDSQGGNIQAPSGSYSLYMVFIGNKIPGRRTTFMIDD